MHYYFQYITIKTGRRPPSLPHYPNESEEFIMNQEINQEVREKVREKSELLPDFAVDCLFSIEAAKSPKTLYEYTKDWLLFFDYLVDMKKVTAPSSKYITVEDLEKVNERDLLSFFDRLTKYVRKFETASGKPTEQTFKNGPQGKARKLASIRTLYQYLIRRKFLSIDPSVYVEFKIPSKSKIRNRLSPNEIQSYFQAILGDVELTKAEQKFHGKVVERDYIISLFLAYMGLRVSELAALDISDVTINQQDDQSHIIVTRKGGDEQSIAMPEQIIGDVEGFIEVRKSMKDIPKSENALFLSLQKKRMNSRTIRQMIEKYRMRAGIQKTVTPHVFRRTFGTKHYNDYGDMYLTARVLGHSSAETTRKHYADPDESRERKSMTGFKY